MYLGALLVLMFFERAILFPAPSIENGDWQASKFGAKEYFVESADNNTKVHVWTLDKADSNKTLIFCHGNGETLGFLGAELAEIRDRWNVNVVAFDFRGYGKTGGIANQADILFDSVVVAKWIDSNPSFRDHQRIVLGRSLGGAAAVEIATKTKVDGLLLDRTFSSTVDIAAERYFFFPIRLVMRNQFRTIDKMPNYTGSLLQMHGDVDEVVPYRFGIVEQPLERVEIFTLDLQLLAKGCGRRCNAPARRHRARPQAVARHRAHGSVTHRPDRRRTPAGCGAATRTTTGRQRGQRVRLAEAGRRTRRCRLVRPGIRCP